MVRACKFVSEFTHQVAGLRAQPVVCGMCCVCMTMQLVDTDVRTRSDPILPACNGYCAVVLSCRAVQHTYYLA